jgi:hypothetical protein
MLRLFELLLLLPSRTWGTVTGRASCAVAARMKVVMLPL